jgi:small subunit ribosomal protein S8
MTVVSDPIGDLLTRMRNAQHARRSTCLAPWSKIKQQLLELLKSEGWIADVAVIGEAPKQDLQVTFHPDKMHLELKRMSKPGRRSYSSAADLKPVLQGFGIAILTTSKGLLTDKEARKQKVGGEVLCTVA